jgi:hypothetical protein
VMAKIFGFFTIRMKSAIDKNSVLNIDVLVMEHLFYNRNIAKVIVRPVKLKSYDTNGGHCRDLTSKEYRNDMWGSTANSKRILHCGTEIGWMVIRKRT